MSIICVKIRHKKEQHIIFKIKQTAHYHRQALQSHTHCPTMNNKIGTGHWHGWERGLL